VFKYLSSLFSILLLTITFAYGTEQNAPMMGPPPRMDLVEAHSISGQIKLARAEKILSTLDSDPQEAVEPFVYSDKPTMIIYQGTLSPDRSNEEAAFVMAHELGHLNLHHGEKMGTIMDKLFLGPPVGISGSLFSIFHQKIQEREADQFGFHLYKQAGYDLNFFPYTLKLINKNPNIHYGTNNPFQKSLTSLSMKDSHFSMQERFELLVHLCTVN
jgi:Zn-dependent protease with chaperone function